MTNRTTPVGTVDEELVGRLRGRVKIETACGNRTANPNNHVRLMDEAATLIEQLRNRVERLVPIVEKVAARRTNREILTGIVGEAYLPPEPSGEADEFILEARAALTGEHNG